MLKWLGALDGVQKVLFYVAVILLLYYLLKKSGFLPRSEPTGQKLKNDPSSPSTRRNFSAKNEAVRVHDMLVVWDISPKLKQEAFGIILGWNDNELREVHNAYIDYYEKTEYPTLRRLVQAEYTWDDWTDNSPFKNETKKMKNEVLQRLTEIGA